MSDKESLKPQNIPEPIVKHLVAELKLNVTWAYKLKSVMAPSSEQGVWNFRLYDETEVRGKGVKVKNYATFDTPPATALFEGTYNPKTQSVQVLVKKV